MDILTNDELAQVVGGEGETCPKNLTQASESECLGKFPSQACQYCQRPSPVIKDDGVYNRYSCKLNLGTFDVKTSWNPI